MRVHHDAVSVAIFDGTIIGTCSCGWSTHRERWQYLYKSDGFSAVSQELQEHVRDVNGAVSVHESSEVTSSQEEAT